MSEDSIIIMNVEQHLLRSRRKKNLPKTLTLFKFHVHKFRKLGGKETADAALRCSTYKCFPDVGL